MTDPTDPTAAAQEQRDAQLRRDELGRKSRRLADLLARTDSSGYPRPSTDALEGNNIA